MKTQDLCDLLSESSAVIRATQQHTAADSAMRSAIAAQLDEAAHSLDADSSEAEHYDHDDPERTALLCKMTHDAPQDHANARLIAAAPELVEALRVALAVIEAEDLDESHDGEAEVIRAALALLD